MHESARSQDSLLQRSIAKLQAKPLRDQKTVWTWCVAATAFVVIIYLVLPAPFRSSGMLLSVVGSFWALAFYLNRKHAEDARFVKELLTEFNDRYDKLGSDLQFALSHRRERLGRHFQLADRTGPNG